MIGGEEESVTTIHYTPFERWVISKSSNRYRGKQDMWGRYTFSSWFLGWLIFGSALFLGVCLLDLTISSVMFLGVWLFSCLYYLIAIFISEFKQRRRSVLFSGLLSLSLSWVLWTASWFFYRPAVTFQALVLDVFSALLWLPIFAISAYGLIRAYKNEIESGPQPSSIRAEK